MGAFVFRQEGCIVWIEELKDSYSIKEGHISELANIKEVYKRIG